MKHKIDPHTAGRSRISRSPAGLVLLAISVGSVSTGCTPEEPKEISAATSGFLPSDKTKSDKPSSKPSATTPPQATQEAPKQGGTVTLPVTPPPSLASGNPTAPAIPTFEPGKVDPAIAAKEYMTLKLGELTDARSHIQFLEKSTRAIRELFADGRRKLVATDLLLERGLELSRMKLDAATSLAKIATTDDEKAAAAIGNIEGLSQMASFGDIMSSDRLRTVVKEEISNTDQRVAQHAKSVSLTMAIADFQSGGTTAANVVAEAESLLQNTASFTNVNLNVLAQAIELFDSQSQTDYALQLAKKTEEACRDHSETQIALASWQLHASRLEEAKKVATLADPSSAEVDEQQAKQVAGALLEKIDSPWSAFFLAKVANDLEYTGRIETAKGLVSVASSQLEKIKNEETRNELTLICKQFDQRLGLLNNVLDMSSLVDLEGKPIDMERYKGKVVLVDFWASWCRPCIQEIPNIEKVFQEKNKDGFEVIGVNLDEDRSKLDAFLTSKQLAWTTYVSNDAEAKGFNAPIAKNIGIAAIPFIAVIGRDGKVAAIHVRGPKVESKIAELLAKE